MADNTREDDEILDLRSVNQSEGSEVNEILEDHEKEEEEITEENPSNVVIVEVHQQDDPATNDETTDGEVILDLTKTTEVPPAPQINTGTIKKQYSNSKLQLNFLLRSH